MGLLTGLLLAGLVLVTVARLFVGSRILFRPSGLDLLVLCLLVMTLANGAVAFLTNDILLTLGDMIPLLALCLVYFAFRFNLGANQAGVLTGLGSSLVRAYWIIACVIIADSITLGGSVFSVSWIHGAAIPRIFPGFVPELVFFLLVARTLVDRKAVDLFGLAICSVLILLSQGRAIWIGIGIAGLLALFAALTSRETVPVRRRLLVIGVLFVSLLLTGNFLSDRYLGIKTSEVVSTRMAGILNLAQNDIRTRTAEIVDGAAALAASPWGYGLGGTLATLLETGGKGSKNYLHNAYIDLGVKMGIPGLALFLLIMSAGLKRCVKLFRRTGSFEVLAFFFGILALLIASNFSPTVNKIPATVVLGAVLACVETGVLAVTGARAGGREWVTRDKLGESSSSTRRSGEAAERSGVSST
jgi:O-antigen ligase